MIRRSVAFTASRRRPSGAAGVTPAGSRPRRTPAAASPDATARAFAAPVAQQRRQLAAVVEQLAVALLDRRQQLDHGVGGVGLQRPVLRVALGEVGRRLVGGRAEDVEQVADARLLGRVVAHLVLGVGDGPLELAPDHLRVVHHLDHPGARLGRLRHLGHRVLEVHDAGPGARRRRLRHDERLAEAVVEAQRDVAGDLDVLALVVADRHVLGVVEQDVGRLQRRVREQAAGDELALGRLVLELRHARQLAEAHRALHDPRQLAVLGHVALHEHRGHVGVEADGEQHRRQLDRALADDAGLLRRRSGRGGRRCRGTRRPRAARRPSSAARPGSCPDGRHRSAGCTRAHGSRLGGYRSARCPERPESAGCHARQPGCVLGSRCEARLSSPACAGVGRLPSPRRSGSVPLRG